MKDSFVLYSTYFDQVQLLNMEQRGVLLTNIMLYQSDKELVDMDGITTMAFSFIKAQLDKDSEKYDEACKKRAESARAAANRRWKKDDAIECDGMRTDANACERIYNDDAECDGMRLMHDNDNEYENDNDNENDNDYDSLKKEKPKKKKAAAFPDPDEVDAFPDDEELSESFREFLRMRKGLKKPATQRAVELAVKHLTEMSIVCGMFDRDMALEIVNNSIRHSWLDFYALKNNASAKDSVGGINWDSVYSGIGG